MVSTCSMRSAVPEPDAPARRARSSSRAAGARRLVGEALHHLAHELGQVDAPRAAACSRPDGDARDVEQVVDQLRRAGAPGARSAPAWCATARADCSMRSRLRSRSSALQLKLQRGERRAQLVRGDRQELVADADRVLRRLVQPRVLDRERHAAAEVLGRDQIGGAVAPRRAGRGQHDRTEGAAARGQRHDDRRFEPELPGERHGLGVAREQRRSAAGAGDQHRRASTHHTISGERILRGAAAELVGLCAHGRVGVACRVAARPVASAGDIDQAPVGQRRHDAAEHVLDGLAVVERAQQVLADHRQDALAVSCQLALGDVLRHGDELPAAGRRAFEQRQRQVHPRRVAASIGAAQLAAVV